MFVCMCACVCKQQERITVGKGKTVDEVRRTHGDLPLASSRP